MQTNLEFQQEVFDKAVDYLQTMNDRSAIGTSNWIVCRYRGYDGNKCVVGYFIDDSDYELCYDEDSLHAKQVLSALSIKNPEKYGDLYEKADELLAELQKVHDCVENWGSEGFCGRGDLELVASRFRLKLNI